MAMNLPDRLEQASRDIVKGCIHPAYFVVLSKRPGLIHSCDCLPFGLDHQQHATVKMQPPSHV